MNKFAVIYGEIIIDLIIADTKEIAEKVTGKTCIEITENDYAAIGYKFNEIPKPVIEGE